MKYDAYGEFTITRDFRTFEFVSEGKYGFIRKQIAFIPTEIPQVYNLAFGDVQENDEVDDNSISDNGDRDKILATLVRVIERYTERYPERWIYFRGNTKGRTRLYRMAVGLNLEELSKKFEIYAEINDTTEFRPFCKNMPISAFLIKRKND